MKEIWKSIKDFDRYQVSNLGRVRSRDYTFTDKKGIVQHFKGKELKQGITESKNDKGYKQVYLYDSNHNRHTKFVHRLVAEAFIPNPNSYSQVNHKDEDEWNNCVDNLEWCTALYNSHYGKHIDHMKRGMKAVRDKTKPKIKDITGTNKDKRKVVYSYDFINGVYNCFRSLKECSLCLGISSSKISRVIHGQSHRSKNFIFAFSKSEITEEKINQAISTYNSIAFGSKKLDDSKIIVMSDVHLTNYSNFNYSTDNPLIGSRLYYILKGVEQYFNYGANNNISNYVINGDLFDKRQRENPSLMAYLNYFIINNFRNTTPYGSQLFMNIGNHEEGFRTINPNSISNFSAYSVPGHKIQICNDLINLFKINDTHAIVIIPYTEQIELQKEAINNLFNKIKTPNITVFAHLGVNGATQGRWNHRLSSAFNLQDLAWDNPDVKNIVLGHYHSRQSLKKQDNKEAWYVGDLTELNFNDIQKNGYGAPRGFDVVDTEGGHTFVDLTKAPYNLPTFNSFDLDKDKISTDKIIDLLKHDNYVRLMVSDKDKYEKLSEIVAKEYPNNIQLILKPQPKEHDDIKIDPNTTDNDLVAQYCEKHYPEIKDQALEYLRKAKES